MALFHLRATTVSRGPGSAEVDFFVLANTEAEAGARAQDAFREKGWAFGNYVVVPYEVNPKLLEGALAQVADVALKDGESFYVPDAA